MRRLKLLPTLLITSASLLSGCVAVYDQGGVDSLANLQKLGEKSYRFRSVDSTQKNTIRSQMLTEQSMSIGAQGGLAWQYRNIVAALEENSRMLDRVFNFHALILPHNVMPPILLEGQQTLKQEGDSVIRITDRTYKIKRQAHFVTAPPDWRQYVLQTFPAPELPPHNMLPKNADEQALWAKCAKRGWEDGLKQAVEIFNSNLSRLVEDYRGMIVYRKLLAQDMVTPPFVAKTELGVTGNVDQLNVNDQVLRIAVLPRMQIDSKRWNPTMSSSKPSGPRFGSKTKFKLTSPDQKAITITQRLINK
jgi:defect in organelle trafficking protein DotC